MRGRQHVRHARLNGGTVGIRGGAWTQWQRAKHRHPESMRVRGTAFAQVCGGLLGDAWVRLFAPQSAPQGLRLCCGGDLPQCRWGRCLPTPGILTSSLSRRWACGQATLAPGVVGGLVAGGIDAGFPRVAGQVSLVQPRLLEVVDCGCAVGIAALNVREPPGLILWEQGLPVRTSKLWLLFAPSCCTVRACNPVQESVQHLCRRRLRVENLWQGLQAQRLTA